MATVKGKKGLLFDTIDYFDGVTNDSDSIFGYDGSDTIFAGGGNDLIWGGEGADDIWGGDGIDTVCFSEATSGVGVDLSTGQGNQGEAAFDTYHSIENALGSNYDDKLVGNDAINSLWGEGGDDDLRGKGGDDSIWGGLGDDQLRGGSGADKLYGGPDRDTASYVDSSAGVHVSLASGTGLYGDAAGDTLFGIENLEGSSHSDQLLGDDDVNTLDGRGGDDHLKGFGGADEINGWGGVDTVYYGDSSTGVYVSLAFGVGMGFSGSAAGDTLSGIENISGSDYADVLYGYEYGVNKLMGQGGDDTLQGFGHGDTLDGGADIDTASYSASGAGVSVYLNTGHGYGGDAEGDTLISIENLRGSDHGDTLWGNNDANVLEGRSGNDELKGFGGADVLVGGMGADSMSGGLGPDIFVWEAIAETGLTAASMDFIVDFDATGSDKDKIDLHAIDANATINGNQNFTFIGTAGFSAPGQIRYVDDGVDTFIILNTDANPLEDAAIRIAGLHTPDASWFAL
jgi:Ca2+-binding RTX toxin-like protein